MVERYAYEPYGQTIITDSSGAPRSASAYGNAYAWTGQRYDPDNQLYHFYFRTYSPHLGRWLQRDPLGYVDSANMYKYVMSRPVSMADMLGLQSSVGAGGPPTVAAAGKLAQQAMEALRNGDLAKAQQLLRQAQDMMANAVGAPIGSEQTFFTGLQRAIEAARNINPSFLSQLSKAAKDALQRAITAISDHLQDLDIKGAIEEIKTGIQQDGQHLKEVREALNSVVTAVTKLQNQLDHLIKTKGDPELIKAIEQQIANMRSLYDNVFRQLTDAGLKAVSQCP